MKEIDESQLTRPSQIPHSKTKSPKKMQMVKAD